MEEQQKFSLFELERIDIEELKNQFSEQINETDNLTRYNIALELAKEGRLKDCPLLSNEYDREIFENIIISEYEDEQYGIVAYLIPRSLWESHRILCVYLIYSENILVPDWYDKNNPTLFEYPIYYDESYFEEIHNLNIDDLYEFLELFKKDEEYEYYWVYTHLLKELAERIYDDVRDLPDDVTNLPDDKENKANYIYHISEYHESLLSAHLYVLANERQDEQMKNGMFKAMNDIKFSYYEDRSQDKAPQQFLYDLNPNVETAKNTRNINDYNDIGLVLGALSSVMGTSPYSALAAKRKIDYKTFTDILKYALDVHKIFKKNSDCTDLFLECVKIVQTDKAKKYLLTTMLNICGQESLMDSLVSKYNIVSHIPEGYYQ